MLWSCTGSRDFKTKEEFKTMSVMDYINQDFPPTFMSVGFADPLAEQSYNFHKELKKWNVPTTALFYKPNHLPKLEHEYQFDLTQEDGKKAFEAIVKFANER